MIYRKNHVWLLLLVMACAHVPSLWASGAQEILAQSPTSKFKCIMEPRKSGGGIVYLVDSIGGRVEIFNTGRYVDVTWSAQDQYFAIQDHPTGDSSIIRVYEISVHQTKSKNSTELLYQTPPEKSDVHWSLLRWDLNNGSVKLKCKYASGDNPAKKTWNEKIWTVPILIPRS